MYLCQYIYIYIYYILYIIYIYKYFTCTVCSIYKDIRVLGISIGGLY